MDASLPVEDQHHSTNDDLARIKILQDKSHALEQENVQKALKLLQQAIDLAEHHLLDPGYLLTQAECLHTYGFLSDQLADYGTALASYNRALEIFKTLDRHLEIAREENHIGVIFGRLGDHSTSIRHLLTAYQIYEDQQDASQQVIVLNNIGFSYVLVNEHQNALHYLLKGLKFARENQNDYALAITLDSLCHAYRGLRDYDNALACGLESIQVCRKIGGKRAECEYCLSVGVIYMDRNETQNALDYFKKCQRLAKKFGFRREEAEVLRHLAAIHFKRSQTEQAFSLLQQALIIAEDIEARHEIFKTHADLAAAYKQAREFEKALTHYERFHIIKEEVFNDQADMRLKSLETAHRLEQAQKEAQIYQLRNQALQTEIEERKIAQAEAEHNATIDPLTGLNNRRHFFYLAERAFTQALYETTSLCVIMFDIDHFKKVNDTYGHLIGDKVLIGAANIIRKALRTTKSPASADILGRYGGEEFSIILPETTSEQGHMIAERIRRLIETTPIETEKGPISITFSGGVGIIFMDDTFSTLTLNILIDRADQALYQAKHAGRNQTVIFQE